MDSVNVKPSLSHHIGCNRAVDTARKEKKSVSAASYGHTALAGKLFRINKSVGVADFENNRNIGIVDIDLKMRISG